MTMPRCGATRKGAHTPCQQAAGVRTDHPGFGRCWLHGGRTQNGRLYAAREAKFAETLDAIASLTLTEIADRLARLAAGEILASANYGPGYVERLVNAFARAAERAEGSKVSIEHKIEYLAQIPDDELEAAIAEAERLVSAKRAAS